MMRAYIFGGFPWFDIDRFFKILAGERRNPNLADQEDSLPNGFQRTVL
jgi:hypothetical protein